jgi:hypothetical protein
MVRAEAESERGVDAPFVVSNPLLGDGDALRARMSEDGCLFFRGLVSAGSIGEARREILHCCAAAGWLRPGTSIEEGIAALGVCWTEPQPEFMAVYNAIQKGEAFHALAHDRALIAMLEAMFGEPALPHPRNIARIIFPQNTLFTTPSHQDYVHVQGTEETYTAWIPLGDCPQSLGSLAVLAGSHRAGILPVHRAYGAGGVGIDTEELPNRWVGGDFHVGDVVVFHSLAVHKALPNVSPDRIRLSVDYRYQPLSHPIAEDSLRPHHGQIDWPEVYAGWRSERYQYYWQGLPTRRAERDPRVHAVRQAADRDPLPAPPKGS